MNIKLIEEMDDTELGKVFNQNKKLQYDVLDDMLESEMGYISEQLEPMKIGLSDWSVGTNSHCYMTIGDSKASNFLEGLKQAQKDYCTLMDNDVYLIEEAENMLEEFNNAEYCSDEYYELEESLNLHLQEIADKITKMFEAQLNYCYGREEQEGYFIEFYSESRLEGNEYTRDESYTLYEDVAFTKSFN